MRVGPNYLSYPVDGESIQGSFAYADRHAAPFTAADDEAMATVINRRIEEDRASAWFSQERDGKVAKVNGVTVELNGQPVRFSHPGELAVFLCESRSSAA
jgi:hypothetical protein